MAFLFFLLHLAPHKTLYQYGLALISVYVFLRRLHISDGQIEPVGPGGSHGIQHCGLGLQDLSFSPDSAIHLSCVTWDNYVTSL